MAVINNTLVSYNQVGIRENLADTLSRITPEDTPFISNAGTASTSTRSYDWLTDALLPVDTNNDRLEGDDVDSYDSIEQPVRLQNVVQISRKTLVVSDTSEELDLAGRKSDLARAIAKRGIELRRDIEAICVGLNRGGRLGGAAQSSQTATLLSWIKTNVDRAANGVNPAWVSGMPTAGRTDGTQRAFAEAQVKNIAQLGYAAGAKYKTIMAGPVQRQRFSDFTGSSTHKMTSGDSGSFKIVGTASVYYSDFGTFTVMPNRHQRNRDVFFIDWDMVRLRWLRPIRKVDLAKTGDNQKKMLIGEWGLEVRNELGLGLIADLT